MITAQDILTGLYKEEYEVTVSALQLQKVIQRMQKAERELKICKKQADGLKTVIEMLKQKRLKRVILDIYA